MKWILCCQLWMLVVVKPSSVRTSSQLSLARVIGIFRRSHYYWCSCTLPWLIFLTPIARQLLPVVWFFWQIDNLLACGVDSMLIWCGVYVSVVWRLRISLFISMVICMRDCLFFIMIGVGFVMRFLLFVMMLWSNFVLIEYLDYVLISFPIENAKTQRSQSLSHPSTDRVPDRSHAVPKLLAVANVLDAIHLGRLVCSFDLTDYHRLVVTTNLPMDRKTYYRRGPSYTLTGDLVPTR